MLIHGCKTGSKIGNLPKIANLFKQNGRGQDPRQTIFYLNYYAIKAKIFKTCGLNSSHII